MTISHKGSSVAPRIAAVIGGGGELAAFTILAEWRDPTRPTPKDRDFALGLGPVVVTPDAFDPGACVHAVRVYGEERMREGAAVFDCRPRWRSRRKAPSSTPETFLQALLAQSSTALPVNDAVEVEVDGIGTLEHRVAG